MGLCKNQQSFRWIRFNQRFIGRQHKIMLSGVWRIVTLKWWNLLGVVNFSNLDLDKFVTYFMYSWVMSTFYMRKVSKIKCHVDLTCWVNIQIQFCWKIGNDFSCLFVMCLFALWESYTSISILGFSYILWYLVLVTSDCTLLTSRANARRDDDTWRDFHSKWKGSS